MIDEHFPWQEAVQYRHELQKKDDGFDLPAFLNTGLW